MGGPAVELGTNGWELVQVIPGVETTYWFKRQS